MYVKRGRKKINVQFMFCILHKKLLINVCNFYIFRTFISWLINCEDWSSNN